MSISMQALEKCSNFVWGTWWWIDEGNEPFLISSSLLWIVQSTSKKYLEGAFHENIFEHVKIATPHTKQLTEHTKLFSFFLFFPWIFFVKRVCWGTLISIYLLHIHFPFSFFIHQITLFMFSPFLSLSSSLYSFFKFMPGTATQLVCSFCVEVEKALKFAVAEKQTEKEGKKKEL